MENIKKYMFDDAKLLEEVNRREVSLKKKECKKKARSAVGLELKQARKKKLVLYSIPLSGVLTTSCIGVFANFSHNDFLTTVTTIVAGTTILFVPSVIELIKSENDKIHVLKIKENFIYKQRMKNIYNLDTFEKKKKKY